MFMALTAMMMAIMRMIMLMTVMTHSHFCLTFTCDVQENLELPFWLRSATRSHQSPWRYSTRRYSRSLQSTFSRTGIHSQSNVIENQWVFLPLYSKTREIGIPRALQFLRALHILRALGMYIHRDQTVHPCSFHPSWSIFQILHTAIYCSFRCLQRTHPYSCTMKKSTSEIRKHNQHVLRDSPNKSISSCQEHEVWSCYWSTQSESFDMKESPQVPACAQCSAHAKARRVNLFECLSQWLESCSYLHATSFHWLNPRHLGQSSRAKATRRVIKACSRYYVSSTLDWVSHDSSTRLILLLHFRPPHFESIHLGGIVLCPFISSQFSSGWFDSYDFLNSRSLIHSTCFLNPQWRADWAGRIQWWENSRKEEIEGCCCHICCHIAYTYKGRDQGWHSYEGAVYAFADAKRWSNHASCSDRCTTHTMISLRNFVSWMLQHKIRQGDSSPNDTSNIVSLVSTKTQTPREQPHRQLQQRLICLRRRSKDVSVALTDTLHVLVAPNRILDNVLAFLHSTSDGVSDRWAMAQNTHIMTKFAFLFIRLGNHIVTLFRSKKHWPSRASHYNMLGNRHTELSSGVSWCLDQIILQILHHKSFDLKRALPGWSIFTSDLIFSNSQHTRPNRRTALSIGRKGKRRSIPLHIW